MLDFSGKANISIHGLGEDDTTRGGGERHISFKTHDIVIIININVYLVFLRPSLGTRVEGMEGLVKELTHSHIPVSLPPWRK